MVVRNEKFTAFIDEFTASTYIMVICSNPDIEQEAIALNIKASKDYFESIMQSFQWCYSKDTPLHLCIYFVVQAV